MKQISFFFRCLSALLAAALVLSAAPAKAETGETLTIMVFMCGSNLESGSGAATDDLMEMANSGYDLKHVNVLVMTGGTTRWRLGLPTDALCIYQPGRGTLRMLTAFEDMSMGTPEALEALLCFGYERFPADRYGLILWDHGGGPLEGVCWDERYHGDRLTLEELTGALAASPVFRQPLEWIGFDACLMASTEVAAAMAPFARYMTASQESEPASGWNYAFLGGLSADTDGAATGHRIIESYFENEGPDPRLTLSCLDLGALKDLEREMDTFFGTLSVSEINYSLYSYAAYHTRTYGRAGTGEGSYDLADLGELIRQLSWQDESRAEAVTAAMHRTVSECRSGDGSASGLSVYHPYENKEDYASAWADRYPTLRFSEGYTRYISDFAAYLFGEQQLSWKGLTLLPTDQEKVYALPLTESQESMVSTASLDLLIWDEGREVYALIGSAPCLAIQDGAVFAADPGRVLRAEEAKGASSGSPIPWEPAPDGQHLGIYVNLCRKGAENNPEAVRIVPVNTAAERKTYGDSGITIVTGGTDSQDGSSLGQVSQTGLTSEAELTTSRTETLSTALAQQGAVEVAYAAPAENLTLTAAVAVPLPTLEALGRAENTSLQTFLSPDLSPQPLAIGTIVPVSLDSNSGSMGKVAYAGSQVTLDSFVQLELDTFDPDVVEIDLSGYAPEPEPEASSDVLHVWGSCSVSASGEIQWDEIWIYDAEADRWSRGEWPDHDRWSIAVFPVAWRESASSGGALAGVDQWPVAFTEAACVTGRDAALRFSGPEEAYCLAFRLTDRQNITHESMPVMVRQKEDKSPK